MDWDKIVEFERYPNISNVISKPGDSINAVFLDDGRVVTADILQAAMLRKGVKGIRAEDSVVFVMETGKNDKLELWIKQKNFSMLIDLKKIRDANASNLKGAKVKITREAVGDVKTSSYSVVKI